MQSPLAGGPALESCASHQPNMPRALPILQAKQAPSGPQAQSKSASAFPTSGSKPVLDRSALQRPADSFGHLVGETGGIHHPIWPPARLWHEMGHGQPYIMCKAAISGLPEPGSGQRSMAPSEAQSIVQGDSPRRARTTQLEQDCTDFFEPPSGLHRSDSQSICLSPGHRSAGDHGQLLDFRGCGSHHSPNAQ